MDEGCDIWIASCVSWSANTTIVRRRTDFLPKMSEEAPIKGDIKNWSNEYSEPRAPVGGGDNGEGGGVWDGCEGQGGSMWFAGQNRTEQDKGQHKLLN